MAAPNTRAAGTPLTRIRRPARLCPAKMGAPLPPGHFTAEDWTSGHPEDFTRQTALPGKTATVRPPKQQERALWRHLQDEAFLSEPLEVLPEAFPDNLPIQFPKWRGGRR